MDKKYWYSIVDKTVLESERFQKEYNVSPPNEWSLNMAKNTIEELFKHDIKINRIGPSVEEGIFFQIKKEELNIYFEIYNDGDMGYIISNYKLKKIIDNKDITLISELIDRILIL